MIEFEAECAKCGRYQKIEVEIDEKQSVLKVKTFPCYGCIQKLVRKGLDVIKKAVDALEEKEAK